MPLSLDDVDELSDAGPKAPAETFCMQGNRRYGRLGFLLTEYTPACLVRRVTLVHSIVFTEARYLHKFKGTKYGDAIIPRGVELTQRDSRLFDSAAVTVAPRATGRLTPSLGDSFKVTELYAALSANNAGYRPC
jgi:hypothetical protein